VIALIEFWPLKLVPDRYRQACLPAFGIVFMLRCRGSYVRHLSLRTKTFSPFVDVRLQLVDQLNPLYQQKFSPAFVISRRCAALLIAARFGLCIVPLIATSRYELDLWRSRDWVWITRDNCPSCARFHSGIGSRKNIYRTLCNSALIRFSTTTRSPQDPGRLRALFYNRGARRASTPQSVPYLRHHLHLGGELRGGGVKCPNRHHPLVRTGKAGPRGPLHMDYISHTAEPGVLSF